MTIEPKLMSEAELAAAIMLCGCGPHADAVTGVVAHIRALTAQLDQQSRNLDLADNEAMALRAVHEADQREAVLTVETLKEQLAEVAGAAEQMQMRVKELEAMVERQSGEHEKLRTDYLDLADSILPSSASTGQLIDEVLRLRAVNARAIELERRTEECVVGAIAAWLERCVVDQRDVVHDAVVNYCDDIRAGAWRPR